MIYILSEEIQSGKTTSLQLCTENRYDVGGFLSPDKNQIRCLMNLLTKEEIPFEIDLTSYSEEIVIIGKFAVAKSAFDIGARWVKEHIHSDQVKFVIIDEIGPLELEDKGFSGVVQYALENIGDKHLILVIRKNFQEKVLTKFSLSDFTILQKNEIDKLLSS